MVLQRREDLHSRADNAISDAVVRADNGKPPARAGTGGPVLTARPWRALADPERERVSPARSD
jgi:hypothetical protein